MPLPSGKLLDEEVNAILFASGKSKCHRKRKLCSLIPNYETKIRKMSEIELAVWREIGVSKLEWEILMTECPLLITNFNLFVRDESASALSLIGNDTENTPQFALDDEELLDFEEDLPLLDDDEGPMEVQRAWKKVCLCLQFFVILLPTLIRNTVV
jgi:hypothetical protein